MTKTTRCYRVQSNFIILLLFIFFNFYSKVYASADNELTDTASINNRIKEISEIVRSDPEKAFDLSVQVIEASENLNYIQGIFSGNYSLGFLLKRSGRIDSAKKVFKKCIRLIDTNTDLKYTGSIYTNLANVFSLQSEYDSAVIYDEYARQFALSKGDTTNYIIASNNISIVYRYLGMWDSSVAVLKQNEKIIRAKKDTVRLANCIHLQGTIMQGQGNVKAALEHYFGALEIIKTKEEHVLNFLIKVSIATLYNEMEEYQKTIDLLNSIKESYETKVQGFMTLYNTLGRAYQGIDKLDSALYCYQKSVDESLAKNQHGQASISYRAIGDLLNQQGRYSEAEKYLIKSLEISDEKEMVQHFAMTNNSLGTAFFNLSKLSDAEKHFSNAMKIGKELNDYSILKDAANGLRMVNAKKRNFEAAYYFLDQYKQYSDSLMNAENIRLIATKELEFEFNNERNSMLQKQAEENLLHKESLKRQKLIRNSIIIVCLLLILVLVIIYRSYRIKKKADDEKASLMKEIHHRVKNNLQIISSLLSIQTESVTDSGVIDAVKESQSRVKAMALIHQLLYQNNDLARIDFSEYLSQLAHILSSIFKNKEQKVSLTVDAKDITFDIDIAIPLGLIITELVSNAFKYAFTDMPKGKIAIQVHALEEKKYRLTVIDSGKGLPNDINLDTLDSMGLRLVRILTNQLGGKFLYEYNKGSIFSMEFTLSK